ncbi:hypothetical protein PRIPAC_71163 [Pristionchus pacificus]|uniref:Uncharacterized protein n=1 Tax=Pristionchus pacificus TaxID=54126 RepID=A0A2A6CAC2_PRIPA|nr:hypothetical protein PRIPAC_71163 [Pristionchus pacificus]|eukprot:PDM75089.1 hypothetical protein PRIPAC_40470 [Pristionchus pacificus]
MARHLPGRRDTVAKSLELFEAHCNIIISSRPIARHLPGRRDAVAKTPPTPSSFLPPYSSLFSDGSTTHLSGGHPVYDGSDDGLFVSRGLSAAREKGDKRRTTQVNNQ